LTVPTASANAGTAVVAKGALERLPGLGWHQAEVFGAAASQSVDGGARDTVGPSYDTRPDPRRTNPHRRTPFSRQQTRLATFSTFEPIMPASTNSRTVPPTEPACAFAAIVARAKTATEAATKIFVP